MDLSEKTPIQKFYKNSNLFITGASGFLGTALLEKIIRSCPDINTIYLLLREKKNKSREERLEEIFDDQIWDTVKEENPNYKKYIKIISGELTEKRMGLSDEDYITIQKEVNVIFHVAATVRFDEPLKNATKINIQATRDMLELAKGCKNLKAFVHVSTAYSQCVQPTLKEVYYKAPRDPEEFLSFCEKHTQEELDAQLSNIIGEYPNTYTFTKGLAENLVQKYEKDLPITICRPSIVYGANGGPVKGWIKGIFGPVGPMIGIGLGFLHVLPMDLNACMNLVPVDMCVNTMIASAWQVAKERKETQIYNVATSSENPLRCDEYMHWCMAFAFAFSSSKSIWYYFLFHPKTKLLTKFYTFLFHLIPGAIVDGILKLKGQKPKLLKTYKMTHKMIDLLSYFLVNNWVFYCDNTMQLYESLDRRDKKIFCFDLKAIKWDTYLYHIVRFARVHLINDPIVNIMACKAKMTKFKIAHYTLTAVLVLLFCYILYAIFSLFI